jgi:trimeric autotransporter adhesin
MKRITSKLLLFTIVLFTAGTLKAQNTFPTTGSAGIGTTTPSASAILEMKSTTKGVLTPRMTLAQRNAIASPAAGLLIYQTNSTPGFYYYSGSAWQALNNVAGTGISVSGSTIANTAPDKTVVLNSGTGISVTGSYPNFTIGSTVAGSQWTTSGSNIVYSAGDAVINGITIGRGATDASGNLAIGYQTLPVITTGNQNVAVGTQALTSNTDGGDCTGIGYNSLFNNTTGLLNTAVGAGSLRSNTTASYNTAIGYQALGNNTTGSSNTATGINVLVSNTIGSGNTAGGYNSLLFNSTGNDNTANGYQSLYSNTTGADNTANGYQSLYSNGTGSYGNTASGYQSLYANTGGVGNTANGDQALNTNTTGVLNTANGAETLTGNTTGNENTGDGEDANVNAGNYSNTSVFGFEATGTASNQVRIGNSSVTSIGGQVGWSSISDGRVKKNIQQNVPGLAFINKLQPITYNLDLDAADKIVQPPAHKDKFGKAMQPSTDDLAARKAKEQIVYTGFIAQDVETAAKSLSYNFSGVDAAKNNKDLYGLRYSEFVVPLVKAVKELDAASTAKDQTIAAQQQQIDALTKKMDDMAAQMQSLVTAISQNCPSLQSSMRPAVSAPVATTDVASLEQNAPNPFNESTLVRFYIPATAKSAVLNIMAVDGSPLKSFSISDKGASQISISGNTLAAGTYIYQLTTDGTTIAKRMTLTK